MDPADVILVVDDDHGVRDALYVALSAESYDVVCVKNGAEALAYLKSEARTPRLILLDVAMPVLDGTEFRRRQLKDAGIAAIPVVAMLDAQPLAIDAAALLAGLPVVHKPIDLAEVRRALAAHA
jgi:CheY-like chemotaxis protein